MDKILSARLDEKAVRELDRISRKLRVTKKRLLEDMIFQKARDVESDSGVDIFAATSGVWKRSESPGKLRREIRSKFQATMKRHQS